MARSMPAGEVPIDADLVGRLLAQQQPQLAQLPRTIFANGWDNVLVRVGADLLARLPRRAAAAQLVVHECAWMPQLAPRLPLAVPVPVLAGRPGCGYPWSWSVVPFLPGAAARPHDLDRAAAVAVGEFLAVLHRPAPANAPSNPVRGVALARRERAFADNLRLVTESGAASSADPDATSSVDPAGVASGLEAVASGLEAVASGLAAAWRDAVSAPGWDGPGLWLHGDLHPANILVDSGGAIRGVVDFGDLTAGDPATDLAIGWMLRDAQARAALWEAYASAAGHPVDAALRQRARGWAAHLGVAFLANSADNPVMHAIGRHTVAAVLSP